MTHITFKAFDIIFLAEVKATAFIPAKTCCLPEDSYPAEGGEIEEWESLEVETKTMIDGLEVIELTDCLWLMQSSLCDDLEAAAYEALADLSYDEPDVDWIPY